MNEKTEYTNAIHKSIRQDVSAHVRRQCNMPKINLPKRNHQELDYSKLLEELRNKSENNETTASPCTIDIDADAAIAKRKRKKLLQNPEIRFVYSLQHPVVHDRDCMYASRIKDNDFGASSSFPELMEKCDMCYRRALVRAGLPSVRIRDIDLYYNALYCIGITEQELHALTVQHKAQFCGIGKNVVRIKLRDDTWEIRNNGEYLLLLHNNYRVNDNYERIFDGEFHLQMTSIARNGFGYFIEEMSEYSWPAHVELLKARKALRAAELAAAQDKQRRRDYLAATSSFVRLKRISLFYDYYIILDCNDRAVSFFFDNQVNARELAYEDTEGSYRLRKFRIPRKQRGLFMTSMDNLKDYSLEQEYYNYAEDCVEKLNNTKNISWIKMRRITK